jgi:hypothetical protein
VARLAFTSRHCFALWAGRNARFPARAKPGWAAGALGLVALGGCTRTLVLGTDCQELTGICTDESSSPAAGEVDSLDAGVPREEASAKPGDDAGDKGGDAAPEMLPNVAPEAGLSQMDAGTGTPALLTIQNPDFERNGGLGGDLVLRSLLGSLLPNPVSSIIFAELPGWYACWATTVHSVSRDFDLDAGLMQQPQDDYLTFVVNGTPVRQQLGSPMQAGARYALQMEVWGRAEPGEGLSVAILGAFHGGDASTDQRFPCEFGTLLGKSATLPEDAGWTPMCIEFTADRPYTHLLIAPNTTRMPPSGTARLSLDGLRSVSSCTAPVSTGDAGSAVR